jgi:N-acetyl-anhydromuramyl-L-alanine amidase AmpD
MPALARGLPETTVMHANILRRSTLLAAVASLALTACDDGEGRRTGPSAGIDADDAADDDDLSSRDLDGVFEAVADEYDVPMQLLQAIGHVETRWEMIEGEHEIEGREPAFGIMGMRGARLEEAAELAGLDVETVKSDRVANIRAAAAWLDDRASAAEIEERGDIGMWADVVAQWSDLPQEWAQAAYVYVEIYPRMREGAVEVEDNGDIRGELEPVEVYPNFTVPPPEPALQAGPDYELSVWRPSPNFSSRPAGNAGKRAMIIIHTCEGAYVGCYSWLANSQAGVSAHYVVNSTGSEITQLVNESKKGWHISANYKCSLNKNHDCGRNGSSSNNFTIGIEHAGFGNQASWDDGLINASAKLVCNIARDNGISIDDVHVVGHGRLQPNNRTDPGPNWPWEEYLDLARAHCGEGADPEPEPEPMPEPDPDPQPVPTEILIDSANTNNNQDVGFAAMSNQWTVASSTAGFHGTSYAFGSTTAGSDPATFWFHMPQAGTRTIDAWWTAGTNRASAAKFTAFNASGVQVGSATADQTKNGSQWRTLGTYQFSAGWNKVQLSRTSIGSKVVIADGVRVR